jgi:acetolactate synthase I/II/III large subunit
LPFAIGAQFAEPDRSVLCVTGDGGFGHCWAELETVVRHQLPIITVVLNNQILGYQKHGETVVFNAYTDACEFRPVDHAAIARACGCAGVRIEDSADFSPQLEAALKSRQPTLFDVIIDENAHPPITSFARNAATRARLGAHPGEVSARFSAARRFRRAVLPIRRFLSRLR